MCVYMFIHVNMKSQMAAINALLLRKKTTSLLWVQMRAKYVLYAVVTEHQCCFALLCSLNVLLYVLTLPWWRDSTWLHDGCVSYPTIWMIAFKETNFFKLKYKSFISFSYKNCIFFITFMKITLLLTFWNMVYYRLPTN